MFKHFQSSWHTKSSIQKRIFILLAVGPSFAGYVLFTLYPNALSIYYSFMEWNGIAAQKFVGFKNFINMAQDPFLWDALLHNFLLMLFVPPLILIISVFLAYLLNYKGYAESPFLKVLYFFPNVLPGVVVALLWAFMYDGEYGLLNSFLKILNIDMDSYYWLGDKSTAFWALIPPSVWGGVGFYVIIFINAMVGIPKSLYESAILDGANHYDRLVKITLPLLNPVIRICLLFLILGAFQGFEMILILTNGGPDNSTNVISLYMFNMAFGDSKVVTPNYGYASSIGLLLGVILIGAKFLMDKFIPSNKEIEF